MDMELTLLWAIARRELREALRNKWLWLYAAGFAVLAFALSQAGVCRGRICRAGRFWPHGGQPDQRDSVVRAADRPERWRGDAGRRTRARHADVPAGAAGQPGRGVSGARRWGAAMAVIGALSLGFGIAGLALASGGGASLCYLALAGHTFLLALASLGIGFLISTLTRKSSTAMGAALLVWLVWSFVGDLGMMGVTTAPRPAPDVLLGALLANPLQTFKLGAIYSLRATLDTLGPAGQYAMYRFGAALPVLPRIAGQDGSLPASAWRLHCSTGEGTMITRRRIRPRLSGAGVGVPAAACAAEGDPRPPEIAYGHDMCELCGMIISDPRFAAAMISGGWPGVQVR